MTNGSPDGTETEVVRRRLRFRSHHRGCKELDVLLGRFADRFLDGMTRGQLDRFEVVLAIEDPVMLDWLMGRAEPPAGNDVLRMLIDSTGRRR